MDNRTRIRNSDDDNERFGFGSVESERNRRTRIMASTNRLTGSKNLPSAQRETKNEDSHQKRDQNG